MAMNSSDQVLNEDLVSWMVKGEGNAITTDKEDLFASSTTHEVLYHQ